MLHLAVLFICTYLAPIKINGAASFYIMIQLTHFPLFFPLSSLFLSLLSLYWSQNIIPTLLNSSLKAASIHIFHILYPAHRKGMELQDFMLRFNNSFTSLFSRSKYTCFGVENVSFWLLVLKAFNSDQGLGQFLKFYRTNKALKRCLNKKFQ